MNAQPCPSDDVLAQLALGTLSDPERAAISSHVGSCDSCKERAATLPAGMPVSERPTVELAASSAPLTRGTLVGRYVILQLLGSGAMGFVYEAVDPELERKVALKLLRISRRTEEGRARLLREAQAMARLSHPNVVPVFDVGTTEAGDVFVAMELVDGQTLSDWSKAQRDWRQILRYFLYAGRGLAAAHAAGLVHRDFKPHNVLVGKDGRVRVTDFGLVRSVADSVEPTSGIILPPERLGAPLTRDGVLVGTPQYMSPEQLSGEKVDARSDQFSFCVALYEALYRERPFGGERLHEILALQLVNQVRPPPAGSRIPQWVRKALLRGLRSPADERFPTMEALFDALERDPARARRRAALGAALGVLVAGVATVGWLHLRAPSPCAGAGTAFTDAWGTQAQKTLASVFQATGKPFAADAFRALDGALSDYAKRGERISRTTCAARVERQVPEETYSRQTACLHQRQRELSAFVSLLARSDAATLANSAPAVTALPALEDCTRPSALAVQVSPEQVLHADETQRLRAGLAEVRAQNALGRYADVLTRVDQAQKEAPHLLQTPLAAELKQQQALAEARLEKLADSAEGYRQAALLAERYGDDALAALSWSGRAAMETALAHYPEAEHYLDLAHAKLDRLGTPPPAVELDVYDSEGQLSYERGNYADAASQYRKALAVQRAHPEVMPEGPLHERIGNAEVELGHLTQAGDEFALAVSLTERELGHDHPQLSGMLGDLATVRMRQNDDAAARDLLQRALAINAASLGPDNLARTRILNNLAVLESNEGHEEKALELLRKSREIKEQRLGASHPDVASALINEASSLGALGRNAEAEAALERATRVLIAAKGADHPDLVAVYLNLGGVQRGEGHYAAAELSCEKAVEIARKRLGAQHPWTASSLFGLAMNQISLDRWAQAQESLSSALSIQQANKASGLELGETKFGLAQVRWFGKHDRRGALQLVGEAIDLARKDPHPNPPAVAEMEQWRQARQKELNAR